MKRTVSILLLLSMLFCFAACGKEDTASLEVSNKAEPSPAGLITYQENEKGYIIPTAWAQDSINDGTWGYVTSGVENGVDAPFYEMTEGHLNARLVENEGNVLLRLKSDGTEDVRLLVPRPELQEGDDWSVGQYRFGTEWVWFIENHYTLVNEETGELDCDYVLKKWSLSGEELVSIPLDASYGITPDGFLSGLELDPEGNPVLMTLGEVLFCGENGEIVARYETGEAPTLKFVRDTQGRTYCNSLFEGLLYTMDWENHCLGEPVLELGGNEQAYSGGGGYDLLLMSDTVLKGICFETGTITEILNWADYDLGGMVGAVSCLDEEHFLVNAHDLLLGSSMLLKLTRVPAGEIPQKTVITMAVPLNPATVEWGGTWADTLDQMVATQMANFNRSSETHRVEIVTYSSAQELQLMLLGDDPPDIIDWNYTGWLEDTPSLELYAAKGYLADLESLFEADEELALSDFIPSIVNVVRERTGGLYSMPVNFYLTVMSVPGDYVEGMGDWNYGDMLAIAKQLPEDMALWSYISQRDALDTFLRTGVSQFVDIANGSCSFQNQTFYDLLELCRNHFPEKCDESYVEPAGGSVVRCESVMGRMGQFASDVLRNLEPQGRTLIGTPGTGGNGFEAIFYDEFSICTLGDQQEAAWEFLRTLYSYEYQNSAARAFCAVREDAFHEREDQYLEFNGSCTPEESQAARELVYGVGTIRNYTSPVIPIVMEEAEAFFAGDKTAEQVAEIIESRVKIYLSEQS